MRDTHGSNEEQHKADRYEIRLKGHLDARWTNWFEGQNLTRESDGTTVFTVQVADQPALHGVLRKIRDLGLPLISVCQIEPNEAFGPNVHENNDSNQSKKKETNT
ncbi:hypothetical protein [Paenibacillus cymbidii]|uniref:hypothetical protein n=1 Tax=Paenibacillus cymbidii TaxID=1639034 RepID=UPI001A9B211B|nr:hypothetical protein [Paenibacillus cymbidii]